MIKSHYKWITKKVNENENISLDINPIIKKILLSRGIDTDEKINKFLNSSVSDFYDPLEIKNMKKACERIISALKNNEKVMIYGDYDVDGISSTTVLFSYFNKIGINASYYIPNRVKEGYGINSDAVKKIVEEKYNLIVTVDTGISAIEEAKLIKELGMDLVITDHHEVVNGIPDAICVVDLKQDGEEYPFKELAGVGTAFKTICALDKLIKDDDELKEKYNELNIDVNEYLDIVCLGTISDIVPLLDENRIIVSEGIKRLEKTKRVGLKLLIDETINKTSNITARDIAFMMVPKLNAAGRIDDASICVNLLCEDDEGKAKQIVKELLDKNTERKKVEDKIYNEAITIIDNNKNYDEEKIIVVKNEGWHHGVIGIVASRIAEKYFKPVVIFTQEDGTLSGSARTMGMVNIFEIIEKGKEYLTKFGGHEGAAGLSLEENNYEAFKKCIVEYSNEIITDDLLMPQVNVDLHIDADDINLELLDNIKLLEPYGACNEEPIFEINAKVTSATLMGKNNDHLRLKIKSDNNSFDCVGFYKSDIYENIVIDKNFLMIGTLNINEFNGLRKIQMMLNDIKNDSLEETNYYYYKSLEEKAKLDNFNELIDSDNDEIKNNNIVFVNNVDKYKEMILNDINEYEIYDESKQIKLYIVNNKIDLENIVLSYLDNVKVFYGNINENDILNSINNEGKKVILLANNIMKLVDLRKIYSIIYIDSLDACNYEGGRAIFDVTKEDVIQTYKRIAYLNKINKCEIYLEDLLYNLRELSMYKVLISLDILNELNIINYELSKDDMVKFKLNETVKNPIENSNIFNNIRKV